MNNSILRELVSAAAQQKLNICNVVVRQGGDIIARHDFVPEEPRLLYSVSKAFTSMGVGIAVGEGRFALDDRLTDYFPHRQGSGYDDIRILDLLCMASGHGECPVANLPEPVDAEAEFFRAPLVYRPGERFVYNNAATYMLSRLISVTVGVSLRDYLMPRLFAPLGITNPRWDCDGGGVSLGCTGLYLTATQISLGGQLLLNGGVWEGQQLVPADYLAQATRKQIATDCLTDFWVTADSLQGYGYQLWMNSCPGSYRMDGMMGQYCAVIPSKDAVVTYVSDEPVHMLDILALTWSHLLDKL